MFEDKSVHPAHRITGEEEEQFFDTYEEAKEYGYFLVGCVKEMTDLLKKDPYRFVGVKGQKDPFLIIAKEV